ncbi:hypothetical protein KPH14_004028 [Odynerus spinipes]|uniref:Uncharacterized protein n=1 Tax=Odynerus spinipes TaxID=1348599 RepID=A0AAD9VUX2_9HYME|nr:hypothetical protein KPH14_004028 [Odynerus spinipes]
MCDHCRSAKGYGTASPEKVSLSTKRIDEDSRCGDAQKGCCSWKQSCCGGGCCDSIPNCCSSGRESGTSGGSCATARNLTGGTMSAITAMVSSRHEVLAKRSCSNGNKVPMCYGGECGGGAKSCEECSPNGIGKSGSMFSTIRESDR